jgi:hypothetical protein
MNWDPARPRVTEELGDSVVACGAFGLILGTALRNPAIGVFLGLIVGAMVDGALVARDLARSQA